MNYSLLVRPEAQADLAETQKWYEERATGLAGTVEKWASSLATAAA